MALFPAVTAYQDGSTQKVAAEILNIPIHQLKERTDYLKGRIDAIAGNSPFEAVRLIDTPLNPSGVAAWNMVYVDPSTKYYSLAVSEILTTPVYAYTLATPRSYTVGLLVQADVNIGTVVIYGRQSLTSVVLTDLLESGETFRNGAYYLSTETPGKLTANPKGMAVYVGQFFESASNPGMGDYAIIAPQIKDLYESHLHKKFKVVGQPSGENIATGTDQDDTWTVRGLPPDNPVTPSLRLNIRGKFAGSSSPTYTFWLASPDGVVATARLYWETDDHSDDGMAGMDAPGQESYGANTGVPVLFYEKPISIGRLGVTVFLEMGADPSTWDTLDFAALVVPEVKGSATTWTVQLPNIAQGWFAHSVRDIAEYTGTHVPVKTYTLEIFGNYVNPDNRSVETIRVEVTAGGDLKSDLNTHLQVKDITGTVIATFTSGVQIGKALHIPGHDLWLVFSELDSTGVSAGTYTAETVDSWELSFTDEAPGAKFAYNIEYDPELSAYYPPAPLIDAVLVLNGIEQTQRDYFRNNTGIYRATPRTLFWYNNIYHQAPWPHDWTQLSPGADHTAKNMLLWTSYMRVGQAGIVTSLEPKIGSTLKIVDKKTGQPATVGDLEISADFAVNSRVANVQGFQVFKSVGQDGTLLTGAVVEEILAGNGISIVPSSNNGRGQGRVKIMVDSNLTYGDFEMLLLNAKQEVIPGGRLTSYIKLLPWTSTLTNNVPTAFIGKFRVPYSLTDKYRVVVYATMFGLDSIAGNGVVNIENKKYAGLKFTYSVMQDYSITASPEISSVVQRNLAEVGADGVLETQIWLPNDVAIGCGGTVPGSLTGYKAYDPFVLHNDPNMTELDGQILPAFSSPFPIAGENPEAVTAGNIVSVKIERSNTHPGSTTGNGHQYADPVHGTEYTGALGFVSLKWKLIPVA